NAVKCLGSEGISRLPVADVLTTFLKHILSWYSHRISRPTSRQIGGVPVSQPHRDPSDELSPSGVGMAGHEVEYLPITSLPFDHPFCEFFRSFIQFHVVLPCLSPSPRKGLGPDFHPSGQGARCRRGRWSLPPPGG